MNKIITFIIMLALLIMPFSLAAERVYYGSATSRTYVITDDSYSYGTTKAPKSNEHYTYPKYSYGNNEVKVAMNYNDDYSYGSSKVSSGASRYTKDYTSDNYGTTKSYVSYGSDYTINSYGTTYSNKADIAGSSFVTSSYGASSGKSGLSGNDFIGNAYGSDTDKARSGLVGKTWVRYSQPYYYTYHDTSDYNFHYTPVNIINSGRPNYYYRVKVQRITG